MTSVPIPVEVVNPCRTGPFCCAQPLCWAVPDCKNKPVKSERWLILQLYQPETLEKRARESAQPDPMAMLFNLLLSGLLDQKDCSANGPKTTTWFVRMGAVSILGCWPEP